MAISTDRNGSSLERLKALDSLPNLEAQLLEIQQLCTHAARAEMIMKWLFGRLQSDFDIRQSADAWNALLSTLRLLPPERIATFLSTSKILKTLQTTLEESPPLYAILSTFVNIVNYLVELSEASTGVAVRAGLSLPATEAAEFTGVWLRGCLAVSNHESLATNAYSNLVPALQIWGLRRRSGNENEAFSEQCLAACANLFDLLHSDVGEHPTKKRIHGKEFTRLDVGPALVALLARHIFLPGRSAFLKARATSNMRNVGSQRPSYVLESLLEPLSKVSAVSSTALPRLLDIALRSSPTPSPTQRSQEKPWIEALFSSLHDLNTTPEDRLLNPAALTGMLTVLSRRSHTVSEATLMDIALKHAGLGGESDDSFDWSLVAAIIAVDSALFKDTRMVRLLFDAITESSVELGEQSKQSDANVADEYMYTMWRDQVIMPVLKAYARYNDLSAAIALCAQQLEKDLHGTFRSPWNDLDGPIKDLLEESLLPDQTLAICRKYPNIIMRYNDDRTTEGIEELGAAIVMLNTLLGGVRHEESLEQLHPDLEHAFRSLMELHDAHIGPGLIPALRERRVWSLLTSIFELCFPRWAAHERDPTALVSRVSALMPRSVVDSAIGLTSTVHPEEYASVEDPKAASDAKCFVACVCSHMLAYRDTAGDDALRPFIKAVNALGSTPALEGTQAKLCYDAFLLFPQTLGFMDESIRDSVLDRCIADAMRDFPEGVNVHTEFLQALGSAAVSIGQAQIIDRMVTAYLTQVASNQVLLDWKVDRDMAILVAALSEIPAKNLTRERREKILDFLTDCSFRRQPVHARILDSTLPLMLRLMELPNPTSRICLEPGVLATMAACLDSVHDRPFDDDQAIVEYFESLISLILQQCIQTKDQERSMKMLLGLSSEAAGRMKTMRDGSGGLSVASYTLIVAVFRELNPSALESVKDQLLHRKPSAVKNLVLNVAAAIVHGLQEHRSTTILPSLDLLSAIPPALVIKSEFNLAPLLATLATHLDTRLDNAQDLQQDASGSSDRLVMVRCYQTLGIFAPSLPNVRLCMFADKLLQLSLQPQEHAAVLLTFERLLCNLGSSRVSLVKTLLQEGSSMPASRLLPLQLSIGKLEKHDFDTSEDFIPTAVLYRLLKTLSGSSDFTVSRRTLACVVDVLKMKPFMVNQYNVETTLQALQHIVQRSGPGNNIVYLDVCNTASTLLLHHRSRLQGRFHMMIKLLQTLLSQLFEPLQGWPKPTARHPPTPKHARALARLLKLFCEPPHLRQSQQRPPSLVDESRREQAHVGTFVQHVLHHYCAQVLHGTLGAGMRDALMPGLRAMIEAMEMGGAEGGKAVSAAMGSGERAVLRGLYEEWRRFGKWRGG